MHQRGNEDWYEVEEILDKKRSDKGEEIYLVKWVGYDERQATWEPKKNLSKCVETIKQFQQKHIKGQIQYNGQGNLKKPQLRKQVSRRSQIQSLVVEKKHSVVEKRQSPEMMKERVEENIKVLGLRKNGLEFEFYVQIGKKKMWKNRTWVLQYHPRQLCLFYERNLKYEEN